ncbi:MAG: hypothetical protein ACREC1_10120 [Methylovirgula sp.]
MDCGERCFIMVEVFDDDIVENAFCAKAGLKLRPPTMAMSASFDTWFMEVLLLLSPRYSGNLGGRQFRRARIAAI